MNWKDEIDKAHKGQTGFFKELENAEKMNLSKCKRRGVKGDLSKLHYFDDAYRGAEFYSLQDDDDNFYKEYITKSDRWYVLMVKNQRGNGLTVKEYKEFKSLSLDLSMTADD